MAPETVMAVRRPLAVLTRPAGRNESLAAALAEDGFAVLALPALEIQEWNELPQPFPGPADYDLLVFVSGAAVRAYRRLCLLAGVLNWPERCWVAGVGPATDAAWEHGAAGPAPLPERRLAPGAGDDSYDSEHLLALLDARGVRPASVLVVRASQGRNWLAEQLQGRGVSVDFFTAYHRHPATWKTAQRACLVSAAATQRRAVWLTSSAEGLAALRTQIEAAGLLDWWRAGEHVATHPRLAVLLRSEATGVGPQAMVKICLPLDSSIQRAFVALCSEMD